MKRAIFFVLLLVITCQLKGQVLKIALIKYNGGGDWYANPTSLTNLIAFCNENLNTNIHPEYATVDIGSSQIFNYPYTHITGHGNIIFSTQEAKNLRKYLLAGGFLHIDDNYGLDAYVRRELKKVFPESNLIELPHSHPIYHQKYTFSNGLPKIHQHDDKPPQGFGLFYKGRLVVFYTYETDLGDGWEDQEVHNNSQERRLEALKMGANIIAYCFGN